MDLHLESLWDRNITITTRLVDTVSTPMLLKTLRSHKIDPKRLITHHFKLDRILDAYETFAHAADTRALKVVIEAERRAGRLAFAAKCEILVRALCERIRGWASRLGGGSTVDRTVGSTDSAAAIRAVQAHSSGSFERATSFPNLREFSILP